MSRPIVRRPRSALALPPTSPAVNKGGGALTVDQRGAPRPVAFPGAPFSTAPGGDGADIGAYELQATPVPSPPSSSTPTPPPPPAASATKLWVREVETISGKTTTSYRQLRVVR